jgi:hypothetical protein
VEALAVSPDGKTVLVSSLSAGTFRADADTLEFQRLTCTGVNCLAWNESGLFACGDQGINAFIVGRSFDEGKSYERVLDYSCIRPDYGCDTSSAVGSLCPARWPMIEAQISGFGWCGADEAPPPVFEGCSAGAGGQGDTGAAGGRGANASGGNGPGLIKARGAGCGCSFSEPSAMPGGISLLVVGLSLLAKRSLARRRRRSQAQ